MSIDSLLLNHSRHSRVSSVVPLALLSLITISCATVGGFEDFSAEGNNGNGAHAVGGTNGTGGQTTAAGTASLAGAEATGGLNGSGGVTKGAAGTTGTSAVTSGGGLAAGGTAPVAGTTATGGVTSTGGSASGGVASTGDATSTGGTINTGGASSSGGTAATGGDMGTGGATSEGGSFATGGSYLLGGATGTGGTTASGGATGDGGTSTIGNITATCPGAVPAGINSTFCSCAARGPVYATSGFNVVNNVWGPGPGPQCVWGTATTLWGVTADHPQTSGVKSYPNIGISPRLTISGINTYTSSFDITVPAAGGSWEATYDIWVRSPGGGPTRANIMLWMYTNQTAPISSVVAPSPVTIGGHTWTVHYGRSASSDVISFVRDSNITSGTVDIKAILDWLIANNTTQFGVFTNSWTLDQVQWGFEITSDGTTQAFVNNSFSVTSS